MKEIAWLIERQIGGQAAWWMGGHDWTLDANDAVRLVRKLDAERVIMRMKLLHDGWNSATATEHGWDHIPEISS